MNFYPMRAEIITLDAPPGAIAWIQEWADYTLISYMKEKTDEIAPVPVS
jgi:hypothetical protein